MDAVSQRQKRQEDAHLPLDVVMDLANEVVRMKSARATLRSLGILLELNAVRFAFFSGDPFQLDIRPGSHGRPDARNWEAY